MSDTRGGSSTGIVALVVVLVVVVVLAVGTFAFRDQIFGGGGSDTKKVEINLVTPEE